MPGMTVRLDDELHTRLRLLAIVQHKSANELIIGLVAAEADRVLGAKGTRQPGEAAEKLRRAMGWDELPEGTPEQQAEADRLLVKAQEDAKRIYGEGDGGTVAA